MRYNVKKWGGNMYKTANDYYKEKFGSKVYKLSIDGGFTCPNRDGTVGTGGCIFCSALGSGEFASHGNNITQQLELAKTRVAAKTKAENTLHIFSRLQTHTHLLKNLKDLL